MPALDSTFQRANLSKSFFVLQPVRSTDRAVQTAAMLGTRTRVLYRHLAVALAIARRMSTSSVSHGGRFVPRVGAVVANKYRIERKLGEGGMGFVVAASHLSLGGQVALKFLSPGDELRQEAITRFTREAQSVTRIKSEHVARVLDMGTVESGDPFIVMELLEGMDLHKFVRQNGPLPLENAVEYILQAAEGVADAHSVGIVHRDLKPANLFLTFKPDGSPFVRVLDFGIAKNINAQKEAGEVSLTVGTDVLGSPLYMSPEQIRNPKDVDPRADVWSLGAILYKLLTGRAAFETDSPSASLAMIVMEEPAPVRQFRPDIPPQLEAVLHRCLEKRLDLRWQSVDELACALLPFVPPRPRGRAWRPTTGTTNATLRSTGASTPVVLPPGQTNSLSQRSIVTMAVGAGAFVALGVVLVIVMIVVATSSAKEVAIPKTSNSLPTQPSTRTSASEHRTEVGVTSGRADVPREAPLAPSTPPPAASSSGIPIKGPQHPMRNDALDDRL
jgi:serine/threonine-protein kinase